MTTTALGHQSPCFPIASSSWASPSSYVPARYEVFVSFRGEDTRWGFTSHLCDALSAKLGVSLVYKDEINLEKGASIGPELLKAIDECRVAVVVLSKHYASSTWCLDELVHILYCRAQRDRRVVPIFYEVDPSDVRKQKTGSSFAEAFAKHDRVFGSTVDDGGSVRVQKWRDALTEVANLSGFTTAHYRNESDMIKDIVGKIWKELTPTFPTITKRLVGMDGRVEAVVDLLGLGAAAARNDVRIIGICGMGGSGKTTVAMAVYDTIRSRFEFSTYIAGVREVSNTTGGLLQLQKQLFDQIGGHAVTNVVEMWPEFGGSERLKRVFRGKKMLLVVDDVTHQKQLQSLAMEHSLFGLGSRIIITSRDQQVLKAQNVDSIYQTQLLDRDEAHVLLCREAFKQDEPVGDYKEVCERMIGHVDGLPLALEVLGSSLRGKSVSHWNSTIEKLKRIMVGDIMEVLKISYDALDEEEREIFLDFVFLKYSYVFLHEPDVWMLVAENLCPGAEIGLRSLLDRSLLRFNSDRMLCCMHSLIEEMGRAIVRSECPNEPGQRSRLQGYQDVCHVLTRESGSENVKTISLGDDFYCGEKTTIDCGKEAFSKMVNLKVLRLRGVQITNGPSSLSNELRVLIWHSYPSESLPFAFNPYHLLVLDLRCSLCLKQVWHGNKAMPYIREIRLDGCKMLIVTPDFTGAPNLEVLSLENCELLHEVHPSFGHLKRLQYAFLRGCKSLKLFPVSLEMKSLESLTLKGCSKLSRFPSIGGNMECLYELDLGGTGIQQLPSSIGLLVGLRNLLLENCKSLERLPDSLGCLTSLEILVLDFCCKLEDLPSSLRCCVLLQTLSLQDCKKLRSLPEFTPQIYRVNVEGCNSLKGIPDTIDLRNGLDMRCVGCTELDQPASLAWRKLQRYLQGVPHPEQHFTIVIPTGTSRKMEFPEHWLPRGRTRADKFLIADDHNCIADLVGFVVAFCFYPDSHKAKRPASSRHDCWLDGGQVGVSAWLGRPPRGATLEARFLLLSYIPKGSQHLADWRKYTFLPGGKLCDHISVDWSFYLNVFQDEVEEWKELES